MQQTKETLLEIAQDIISKNKYAMVATMGKWNQPNIRALQNMKNDGFSVFYFVTRRDSKKVKEIKRHKKGTVYFYDKDRYISVTLHGNFKIEENSNYGISDIYKIAEHDLFDHVLLVFETKKMFVYSNYITTEFKMKKKKN